MSKGEEKLLTILRRYQRAHPGEISNIKREVTFLKLTYKNAPLRFDIGFKVRGRQVLLEFDGRQHYEFVKYFHKTLSNFRHMQENDRRKNKYALLNNIPLYRIPYYDLDNIESLSDILRPQYRVRSKFHNDELITKKIKH